MKDIEKLKSQAPEGANVVLMRPSDKQLFFAVEHEFGARYWTSDGREGFRGMEGLFHNTVLLVDFRNPVMKEEFKTEIAVPVAPTPQRRKNNREKMLKYQELGSKVAPKPPANRQPRAGTVAKQRESDTRAVESCPAGDGFEPLGALACRQGKYAIPPALSLHKNGKVKLSKFFCTGEAFQGDIFINQKTYQIKLRVVAKGNANFNKNAETFSSPLRDLVGIKGAAQRIELTLGLDGFYVGTWVPQK